MYYEICTTRPLVAKYYKTLLICLHIRRNTKLLYSVACQCLLTQRQYCFIIFVSLALLYVPNWPLDVAPMMHVPIECIFLRITIAP
jgi:hypothetical protein